MNSWADLSAPLRDEIRNVDAECIIGPSILGAKTGKKEEKLKYLFFFFLLCSFSQRKRRSAANEFECVCMKYDVMRGGEGTPSIYPFLRHSAATASHDFEVLHDVDCGGERKREGRGREGRKIDSAAPVFYHHFRVLGERKEEGKRRHALVPLQKPPKPKPAALPHHEVLS